MYLVEPCRAHVILIKLLALTPFLNLFEQNTDCGHSLDPPKFETRMIHSLCFKAAIRNPINVDWPKLHRHVSIVVVVLGIYVPPAAKVMQRQDLGLKSHLED